MKMHLYIVSFLDTEILQVAEMLSFPIEDKEYRQTSNISRTLVGYKIVDHSNVVGASPVGAVPTTSLFST